MWGEQNGKALCSWSRRCSNLLCRALYVCVSLFIVFPLPKIQKEMYQTNNSHYKHQSQTNSKWNVSTKTGYSTLLYVVVFQGWLVMQDKLALKSGERENKAPFLLFFLFSSPLACYEMPSFFSSPLPWLMLRSNLSHTYPKLIFWDNSMNLVLDFNPEKWHVLTRLPSLNLGLQSSLDVS